MGMYTELHFFVRLKPDTPEKVTGILKDMVNQTANHDVPSHKFFKTSRWRILFNCDSYYFAADAHSYLRYDEIAKQYFLGVQSNLKNYDNEIGLFLDWIMPYVDAYEGQFLGYYRYEEDEEPVLIKKW